MSSTTATSITFNPKVKMVDGLGQYIANHYGEFICPVPEEMDRDLYVLPSECRPYKTLENLFSLDVWDNQQFSCKVILIDVLFKNFPPIWCGTCGKSVTMLGETYYCIHCAKVFQSRSKGLPILVKDTTATAIMTIQGRELKQLTGFQVRDYEMYYKKVGNIPGCFERIKGGSCTLELQLLPANEYTATRDILITKLYQYTRLKGMHM